MGTARRKFQFGYPDGYGAAAYPPAYDSTSCATAFLQYQFRAEQKDMAPPDYAVPDLEADIAQEEFRKKYPDVDVQKKNLTLLCVPKSLTENAN